MKKWIILILLSGCGISNDEIQNCIADCKDNKGINMMERNAFVDRCYCTNKAVFPLRKGQ